MMWLDILPDKFGVGRWRSFMSGVARSLGLQGRIGIHILNDKELCRVNRRVFGKTYRTDVITLLYDEGELTGEIMLSLDAARRQAKERGVAVDDELQRLLVHGLAHLAGHDDMKKKVLRRMRGAEFELLMRHYI